MNYYTLVVHSPSYIAPKPVRTPYGDGFIADIADSYLEHLRTERGAKSVVVFEGERVVYQAPKGQEV
jgi:hypothetical protein